jgi:hypothetical protein
LGDGGRPEDRDFKTNLGYTARPTLKKTKSVVGHRWLTPVILATQEAEISWFKASWANSSRDLISETPNTKMGWWSGSR